MSLTSPEALDEILTVLKDAWDASEVSQDYDIIYPNIGADVPGDAAGPPASPEPYAKVRFRHNLGHEAISAPPRAYTREGTLVVEIRVPPGVGLSPAYALCKVVEDAFEGTRSSPGGVWFRRVRKQEFGSDGASYRVDVLVEFTYDELK